MRTDSQFNFLQVRDGKTYFARVTLLPNPQIEGIKIVGKAGAQIPNSNVDWLEAARSGAEKALQAHIETGGSNVGLEVVNVLGTEVDTTKDSLEVAAFCAAWKALGHDESALKIEFNGHWVISKRD